MYSEFEFCEYRQNSWLWTVNNDQRQANWKNEEFIILLKNFKTINKLNIDALLKMNILKHYWKTKAILAKHSNLFKVLCLKNVF